MSSVKNSIRTKELDDKQDTDLDLRMVLGVKDLICIWPVISDTGRRSAIDQAAAHLCSFSHFPWSCPVA